ncbi:UNKNOWN [Stylonychia lemnae]|uniref:Transmembrane protein n=1 Tax=Stylonychia lemnae TaxID=5949 RepID=A0A077ZU92_STYLE|nr:UNKNOWN [Stylonychia lemnae]|eukprot:CDW73442.1 UNKNOWN [Stylonychia lemnae]
MNKLPSILLQLSLILFLIFNTAQTLTKKRINLSNGASCVFNHNCASGCCDLGFDSSDSLGSYCFDRTYCTSELKNPGQSCSISNECESKCCEDTICQKNGICFNKYVLPFVIVFGVLIVFLVAALIILILYKRKMRRAKMLKRLDDKAKSMLTKLGVKLPTAKSDGVDEIKEATLQPEDLKQEVEEDEDEGPAETHRGNNADVDDNLISKTVGEDHDDFVTKGRDDDQISHGTRRASVQQNPNVKDQSKVDLLQNEDDQQNLQTQIQVEEDNDHIEGQDQNQQVDNQDRQSQRHNQSQLEEQAPDGQEEEQKQPYDDQ